MISEQRRVRQLAFIRASQAELQARDTVRKDFTAANLTAWTTAKNLLEDRKRQL